MNWTRGRLQQHSKSRSNHTVKLQKEHFAKARLKVQNNLGGQQLGEKPPSLNQRLLTTAGNAEGQPDYQPNVDGTTVETKSTINDNCNRPKAHIIGGAENSSNPHVLINSSLITSVPLISSVKSVPPSSTLQTPHSKVENALEKTRCSLLHRNDWLNLATAKPLRINFGHLKRQELIGRRQKSLHSNGAKPLQRWEETTIPDWKKEMHRSRHHEHNAAERSHGDDSMGTESHYLQARTLGTFSQDSAPAQSQNNAPTSSLLLGRYGKLKRAVNERSDVANESPEDYSDTGQESCLQPPLLSLSAVRDCISFDEVRHRSFHHASHSSVMPAAAILGQNENVGIHSVSKCDVQEGRSYDCLGHEQNDIVLQNAVSHAKTSIESPWPSADIMETLEVEGAPNRIENVCKCAESFRSSFDALGHPGGVEQGIICSQQQLEPETNVDTVQCSAKPPDSSAVHPGPSHASGLVSSTMSKKKFVSVSTQTEASLFSEANNVSRIIHPMPGCDINQIHTKFQYDTPVNRSPAFQSLAGVDVKNDCETWVRIALAEDFGQVQRTYELPTTPMKRKQTWLTSPKFTPMELFGQARPRKRSRHKFEMSSSISSSVANCNMAEISNDFLDWKVQKLSAKHTSKPDLQSQRSPLKGSSNAQSPGAPMNRGDTVSGPGNRNFEASWNVEKPYPSKQRETITVEERNTQQRLISARLADKCAGNIAAVSNRMPLLSLREHFRYTPISPKQDVFSPFSMRVDTHRNENALFVNNKPPRTQLISVGQSASGSWLPPSLPPSSSRLCTLPAKRTELLNSLRMSHPVASTGCQNNFTITSSDILRADLRSSPASISATRTKYMNPCYNKPGEPADIPSESNYPTFLSNDANYKIHPPDARSFVVPSSLSWSP